MEARAQRTGESWIEGAGCKAPGPRFCKPPHQPKLRSDPAHSMSAILRGGLQSRGPREHSGAAYKAAVPREQAARRQCCCGALHLLFHAARRIENQRGLIFPLQRAGRGRIPQANSPLADGR